MGLREELKKNLPMDEVETLGEALMQALFDVDAKKVNIICNAFIREVGLHNNFQCKFVPKQLRWDHWIDIELEVIFDGEEHSRNWKTDYYYQGRPALADDKHKGALLLNDILLGIETFLREVFEKFVWADVGRRRLYGDAIFKASMIDL
jgi:hypothetical protein